MMVVCKINDIIVDSLGKGGISQSARVVRFHPKGVTAHRGHP